MTSTTADVAVSERTIRATLPRASTAVASAVAMFLSLFPSYLPRMPIVQGVISALFLVVAVVLTRRFRSEAARLTGRAQQWTVAIAGAALGATAIWSYLTANAMRSEIGMAPTDARHWALVATTMALIMLLLKGIGWMWQRRRVLWRPALAIALIGAAMSPAAPVNAAPAGGVDADGTILLDDSPTGAVRAYAGMTDGESVPARAERAADELVREGGLQRTRVVVMVPTGSGWVDPNAVEGLEKRFGRNVAMVGMQYSRTPSWIAYLFSKPQAEEGAQALFRAVARRIDAMPAAQRPQLHVYGQSLGATAGQTIFTNARDGRVNSAKVCSVLWAGTPGGARVGLPRETSVANADDPIVHTSVKMLFAPPGDGRAWLPVVSYLNAGFDFIGALAVPDGSGHKYGEEQATRLVTC